MTFDIKAADPTAALPTKVNGIPRPLPHVTSKNLWGLYDRIMNSGQSLRGLATQTGYSTRTLGRVRDYMNEVIKTLDSPASSSEVTQEEDHPIHVIIMPTKATFIDSGTGKTLVVYKGRPELFQKVCDHVVGNDFSQESIREVYTMVQEAEADFFQLLREMGIQQNEGGLLCYLTEENVIPAKLQARIMTPMKARDAEAVLRVVAFVDKVMQNPSYRVANELYEFVQAANIEITESGNLVCFKRVRADYKDVFSGTFDNSPGNIVSVPRRTVDENSRNLCSSGLHVCSWSYLANYSGDRVVKVLVEPKDFVSIPEEYFNGDRAKARVCKYLVLEDVTKEFNAFMAERQDR